MTVEELAQKLYLDGQADPRPKVRKRCTLDRCRNVATRVLDKPYLHPGEFEAYAIKDEGYGNPLIAFLMPFILRLVWEFLINRALKHLAEE